jgi:hypothetical protein
MLMQVIIHFVELKRKKRIEKRKKKKKKGCQLIRQIVL